MTANCRRYSKPYMKFCKQQNAVTIKVALMLAIAIYLAPAGQDYIDIERRPGKSTQDKST